MELEERDSITEDIKWMFSAEVLEHLTPSRKRGISHETERKYRREGARFISNTSNTLKLYPQLIIKSEKPGFFSINKCNNSGEIIQRSIFSNLKPHPLSHSAILFYYFL